MSYKWLAILCAIFLNDLHSQSFLVDSKTGTNTTVLNSYGGYYIDQRQMSGIVDSDYQWQTTPYLLSEDFESGNLMTWTRNTVTGTATTNDVQTNTVFSGKYAAVFDIAATNSTRRTFLGTALANSNDPFSTSNYTELYSGIRFYIPSSTYVGTNSGLAFQSLLGQYVTGNVAYERMGLTMSGTTNVVSVVVNSVAKTLTNAITLDAWHDMQIYRKYDSSNAGVATYYLDGNQVYTTNGLTHCTNYTLGCFVGTIDSISSSLTPWKLKLFVDDFRLSTNLITWETNAIKVAYPDARGRIGMNLAVMLTGQQPNDTLNVKLTASDGTIQTVTNILSPSGRSDIKVSLRGLPRSMITLNTTWSNSSNVIKGSNIYTYAKTYVGDPYYSIDERNSFTTNGTPYFPIQAYFLPTNSIASWGSSNVINSLYADLFGATTSTSLSNYLAQVGTLHWVPWLGKKPALGVNPSNDVSQMTSLIASFKDNSKVAGWTFIDEPELYQTYSPEHFTWWQAAKAADPTRPVWVNIEGTVMDRGSGFNVGIANTWSWPHIATDVIGFDMYPLDNPASYNFDQMSKAVTYTKQCNYDILPVFGYVAPCDTKEGTGHPGPTPGEIEMQNWILVNSGAKAVQYFPYNGSTGFGKIYESNLVQMAHFKTTIEQYSPWILKGEPISAITYPSSTNQGPCYAGAWNYTNSIKVSIVNTSSNSANENVFMNGITAGSSATIDGGSPLTCFSGYFSVTIPAETNLFISVVP